MNDRKADNLCRLDQESLVGLLREVDSWVEECLYERFGLEESTGILLKRFLRRMEQMLGARFPHAETDGFSLEGILAKLPDDNLSERYYYADVNGGLTSSSRNDFLEHHPRGELARRIEGMETPSGAGAVWLRTPDGDGEVGCLYYPFEVHGRKMGYLVLVSSREAPELAFLPLTVELVCERMDDLAYRLYLSRWKQKVMRRLANFLRIASIERALEMSCFYLLSELTLRNVMIVYGLPGDDELWGILFSKGRREWRGTASSYEMFDEEAAARMGEYTSFELRRNVSDAPLLGKIYVCGYEELDGMTLDILELFVELLFQRFTDYYQDKRYLSQFFCGGVVERLLEMDDYKSVLQPIQKETVIFYADIVSFTSLSERKLRTPERIGEFIDMWSCELVAELFARGGVFDKMMGDCIIGLFGPPFWEGSCEEWLLSALEVLCRSVGITREVASRFEELSGIPRDRLGISASLHCCNTMVGQFGPNRSYTCFSAGMNLAARLQGIAACGEIVVTDEIFSLLDRTPGFGDLVRRYAVEIGEVQEERMKNVEEVVRFRRLRIAAG